MTFDTNQYWIDLLSQAEAENQRLRESNDALKAHRATIQGVVRRAEEAEAESQRLRDALEQIASESEHRFPITGGSFAQIAHAALAAVRVEDERVRGVNFKADGTAEIL